MQQTKEIAKERNVFNGSKNIVSNIFAVFTIFSSAKHEEKIDEEPYAANKN